MIKGVHRLLENYIYLFLSILYYDLIPYKFEVSWGIKMDFYEVIEKRRTIIVFGSVEFIDDIIERMIGAGLKAPTNDHMRDWHFIVIKDKQVVLQLLDIIPKGISDEDMDQLLKDWNLND